MRPLLPGDLDCAVRVLLAAPRADWPGRAADLIRAATLADRHRAATGRPHPMWGTGSVMAASSAWTRAALPANIDAAYRAALRVFLDALPESHD